ncbi:MAG: signal peptide peptidase SppA [Nanoarchaeota archaeon]|nr:signal peptide peptidase SppA [Nanoarchaeota archaeon]
MGKIKTIIVVVIVLYLISLLSSKLITSNFKEEIISNGIAIIKIDGTIVPTERNSILGTGYVDSDSVLANLKKADENSGVKAIILEINSGGGAVVASKEIADKVRSIKKPTIALIREVGASGAYWVASSADVVIADELSITGSISVVASYLEYSGLLDKYNITYESLTTGKYKDTGSPFKELTNEERNLLLKKLNIIQERFIQDIARNRNMTVEKVRELATGMIFLGIEAKELGLIDELGNRETAIDKAKELANLKKEKVIEYIKKPSLLHIFDKLTAESFYSMGQGLGDSLKSEEEFKILAK